MPPRHRCTTARVAHLSHPSHAGPPCCSGAARSRCACNPAVLFASAWGGHRTSPDLIETRTRATWLSVIIWLKLLFPMTHRLPSQDLSALLAAPAPAPGPGPKEEADGAGPGRRRARRGRADSTEEGGAVEGEEGELDDDEDEERDGPQHSQEDAEGDPMGVGAVDAENGVEQQQEQEWDIGPPEGPGWDVEMEEAGPDGAKHGLEVEGGDGEEDVGFVASGGGASSDVRPMPGTEEYDTPGAVRLTASTAGAGNVDGDGGAEGQKAEAGGNAAAVDDDEGVAEAGEEPLTPPEANGRQLRPRTRAAAAAAEGEEDSPERKGAKAKDAAATPSARALQRARREREREAEQQAKKKRGGAGGGGRGVTVDDEGPGGSLVSLGAMREWLQVRWGAGWCWDGDGADGPCRVRMRLGTD